LGFFGTSGNSRSHGGIGSIISFGGTVGLNLSAGVTFSFLHGDTQRASAVGFDSSFGVPFVSGHKYYDSNGNYIGWGASLSLSPPRLYFSGSQSMTYTVPSPTWPYFWKK
jgi:hypothetical protein